MVNSPTNVKIIPNEKLTMLDTIVESYQAFCWGGDQFYRYIRWD